MESLRLYHIGMRKRVIPFAYATSLREVDVAFFRKLGITTLLLDLDNTLDPYTVATPSPETMEMAKRFAEAGITMYITSNNKGQRVHTYSQALGVECACLMAKPFSFKIKRLLREKGIDPHATMLVGDQIETDVKAGNGAHVRVLLTEPLDTSHEPWTTKFNRLFDRPTRKKLAKKGYLKDWREFL